jgi:hypothetical protein
MPKENKKTADKKEYQKEYMRNYIANSESITCPVCGGSFHTYSKYKHDRTKKHLQALLDIKDKEEKAELKKKEEELQQKALAEAEAQRTKTTKTIKIKKKKSVVEKKEEEPKPKERPTPAPRKKKEEAKPESLKMLEEYGSSSEEEAEKKPTKTELKDVSFVLQSKKINSEEVAEYIKTQFEASANPDRATATKTVRLNKNASLWRKVSKELDGKTFKELGQNFGKIVAEAYDKPSSQGDFAQMLKQVILHFTKVPKPVEDRMKELIRGLKQKQVESSV